MCSLSTSIISIVSEASSIPMGFATIQRVAGLVGISSLILAAVPTNEVCGALWTVRQWAAHLAGVNLTGEVSPSPPLQVGGAIVILLVRKPVWLDQARRRCFLI